MNYRQSAVTTPLRLALSLGQVDVIVVRDILNNYCSPIIATDRRNKVMTDLRTHQCQGRLRARVGPAY